MPIKPFPKMTINLKKEDNNPAIQLFGRRFHKDQTEIEYLVEFLLLFISEKKIEGFESNFSSGFLDFKSIDTWNQNGRELQYFPPARLNLKLFSFLSASKLETRHSSHIKQHQKIFRNLYDKINTDSNMDKKHIIGLFEQLMLGFVAVAQNRTWSAYTFLPVSRHLLAGESLWKITEGNKNPDITWTDIINSFSSYFDFSKHRFMARGGELLYLHLCNLFAIRESEEFTHITKQMGYSYSIESLKSRIENGIHSLLNSIPALADLVSWVENSDSETSSRTDNRFVKCGWCPNETWIESYCFSIEMANICDSIIDPFEKIELLKLCCIFQVLRSMCAQSIRNWSNISEESIKTGGINGFACIVTERKCTDQALKDAAQQNLNRIQEMIHGAIRNPDFEKPNETNITKGYKIADEQGHSLFLKLSKKINFVAPLTGPGARFVMTENLLRFFVFALIPPGNRWTLDTFKERLYLHYGIAISGTELDKAVRWTYPNKPFSLGQNDHDQWFEDKLRATGLLIPLSDAISLVHNPFGNNSDRSK